MYKKMYLLLFNAITNALQETNIEEIKKILITAQQQAEEICIKSDEEIQWLANCGQQLTINFLIISTLAKLWHLASGD